MQRSGEHNVESDWDRSAEAWLINQGDLGDWGRQYVLDREMMARVRMGMFRRALDVGCGEGRFCRMLSGDGISTVGIDPTTRLLEAAQDRHLEGEYRIGRAEALDFPDASFDLVVSYLSLIDIPDMAAGIAEMARVCAPGGTILIANLTSFHMAGQPAGWLRREDGTSGYEIDRYMEPRAIRGQWSGIDIHNHHRPLSAYMQAFLGHGLRLTWFDEPVPEGSPPEDAAKADRYMRVPYFMIMEWKKSGGNSNVPCTT